MEAKFGVNHLHSRFCNKYSKDAFCLACIIQKNYQEIISIYNHIVNIKLLHCKFELFCSIKKMFKLLVRCMRSYEALNFSIFQPNVASYLEIIPGLPIQGFLAQNLYVAPRSTQPFTLPTLTE